MTRKVKAVVICLLVVIGLLSASTGFFIAKTIHLQNSTKTDDGKKTSADSTEAVATKTSTTAAAPVASEVTQPAPLGNRPSSPSNTVVVATGDTLSSIATKVDVSWTKIAEANGIDPDKIKIGDTLIIPKNNQIDYTVNQEKAASLQKEADGGKLAFRLSATETAKSDSSPVYGLTTTDTFTQTKIDLTAGTATVTVTKNDKTYTITLVQPVTKGEKGIWAISVVKPS